MLKRTIASLCLASTLFASVAFAGDVAVGGGAGSPPATSGPADVPETLVGQPRPESLRVSGWFLAPTFATTSIAGSLAYSPGLRGGIYLNRRLSVGLAINGLGSKDSTFSDTEARDVGAYGGLLLQYVVQSNRLVHVTLESTLGEGRWCTRIGDGDDSCTGKDFLVVEPVANVEINVARHVRVATGVGYRLAVAESGAGPSSRDLGGLVARTSLIFGTF